MENFPGWPEGIQGPELIENMKKQATRFGAEFPTGASGDGRADAHPNRAETSAGEIQTRTLIVASRRERALAGIAERAGADRARCFSCATCDGFFFRGKEIAVVGGGDSAMEEALFLDPLCDEGYAAAPARAFRASKIMLERAMAHPNIELRTNTVVEEVLGVEEKEVTGVAAEGCEDRGRVMSLRSAGCFSASAMSPNAKMFAGQMDLDEDGYIKTTGNVLTTHNGE